MTFNSSAKLIELLETRARLEGEADVLKRHLTLVNNELVGLTKPMVNAVLEREGQASGTVRFTIGNHTFKAVTPKRVEWNNDALSELARRMEWDDAHDFFKITFSMSEADYKSILDPTMRAKLTNARTVKYGDPKISLDD